MFLDERHFYQRGTKIGTWYPPEDRDPFVFQEPGRKGISVFGALSINDGKLFTKITEKYNSMTFLGFLCIVHGKFPNIVLFPQSYLVFDILRKHNGMELSEFHSGTRSHHNGDQLGLHAIRDERARGSERHGIVEIGELINKLEDIELEQSLRL